MKHLCPIAWVLTIPLVSFAQQDLPKASHTDIAYADNHPAQMLDVYLAKSEKPTPAMVYIHGGGWRAGSKSRVPVYLLNAVKQGWLSVVSIGYRFTDVEPHPAQVSDCTRAMQFIRSRAKDWNIDSDRIGVMGNSAGGHLSLWLALHDDAAVDAANDPVQRFSSKPGFAVSLAGPTDWSLLNKIEHKHPAYRQLVGSTPGTAYADMNAEKMKSVSPITHVSKDDPPIFLVHGTADNIVPIDHAKRLQFAMKKAGATSQLRTVKDGGHNVPSQSADVKAVTAYIRGQLIPRTKPSGPTKLSPEIINSLEQHEAITYAKYGDRELQLDLYRPKSDSTDSLLPGIVCIHGGGWSKGTRQSHGKLAMALAAHGYVAVSISYRLSGEAGFPAAIHDAKAAVRWMRANAEKYGIDSDHIGAIGLSAGGHLTALLGTSAGVEELEGNGGNADHSSKIQAAIPMGAQTDVMSERIKVISRTMEIWQKFLGGSQEEQVETYRLASPLTHLEASDPPVLLIAGEFDDPSTRGEKFRTKMNELGIDTDYVEIHGGPHGFIGGQNWFDAAVNSSVKFFDQHLK